MAQHGECVGIVSGKGGTGKTSFTAATGAALAQLGKKVLCVDCDVGLRNLDLAMGLTDLALMDFTDVAAGRCTLEEAVAEHPAQPGLFLLNAPARGAALYGNNGPGGVEYPVTVEEMTALMKEARSRFDYCLLDAPAGLGYGFTLATCAATRVVVIAVMDLPCLRDAQRTVMELERFPAGTVHLVVNRVRRRFLSHTRTTIDDAMDQVGLPLLGLVPEDDALPLSLTRGQPVTLSVPRAAASAAYRNIARRMTGQRVELARTRW